MHSSDRSEIRIYRIASRHLSGCKVDLAGLLDTAEQQRRERLVQRDARDAFAIHHGVLRLVLANATHQDARQIRFEPGKHGKPGMIAPSGMAVDFNLTHTTQLALIAVCHTGPVGVDCERLDRAMDVNALGRRVLAPSEQAVLENHDDPSRRVAFLHYWTGKEAYLKALGQGIATPLREIELSPPGRYSTPIADRRAEAPGSTYWLHGIDAGPDHVAALVTLDERTEIRMIDVTPGLVSQWLQDDAAG